MARADVRRQRVAADPPPAAARDGVRRHRRRRLAADDRRCPGHWAGRALELNLGPIADADTTFVGGEQVGQGTGRGPRRYTVPASVTKAGPLPIAVRVFNQAGPGGFLGQTADVTLGLPDDVASTPWYQPGYRTTFNTGDDPFRYYRW
jgi:hypothetical protein